MNNILARLCCRTYSPSRYMILAHHNTNRQLIALHKSKPLDELCSQLGSLWEHSRVRRKPITATTQIASLAPQS